MRDVLQEQGSQHEPRSKQGKWGGGWLSSHGCRLEVGAATAAVLRWSGRGGSRKYGSVGGTLSAAQSGSWFVRWTRLHWRWPGGRCGHWLLGGCCGHWLCHSRQLSICLSSPTWSWRRLCCRLHRQCGLHCSRLRLRLLSLPRRLRHLCRPGLLCRLRCAGLRRWSPSHSG